MSSQVRGFHPPIAKRDQNLKKITERKPGPEVLYREGPGEQLQSRQEGSALTADRADFPLFHLLTLALLV